VSGRTIVIDPARSLAVTDPAVLAKFSFKRVLSTILQSAHGSNTPLQLYQAWMATFADCSNPARRRALDAAN
jgi:hypothetical protein